MRQRRGRALRKAFIVVSWEGTGEEAGFGWTSLNNFSGLRGKGAVWSCLGRQGQGPLGENRCRRWLGCGLWIDQFVFEKHSQEEDFLGGGSWGREEVKARGLKLFSNAWSLKKVSLGMFQKLETWLIQSLVFQMSSIAYSPSAECLWLLVCPSVNLGENWTFTFCEI